MKIAIIIFSVLASLANANPIVVPDAPASAATPPQSVMVGEEVTVTVTRTAAIVSGKYRFRVTPETSRRWFLFRETIELPVPIPASASGDEAILALVHPLLTIHGVHIQPEQDVRFATADPLPPEANAAFFRFLVNHRSAEFEVQIDYDQPVIRREGKDIVYYVPYLPAFQRYASEWHLHEGDFQVRFSAGEGVRVRRLSGDLTEVQSLVEIARHKQPIAVERTLPGPVPQGLSLP